MTILNVRPGGGVFLRFMLMNLLILLPPFIVSTSYFAVASNALSRAADETAIVQLEANIAYVDRKLLDLDKIVSQLVVDYGVNRYLNAPAELFSGRVDPVALYDSRAVSERLSAILLGGEFLERVLLYLAESDSVIYEGGYASYPAFYGSLLEAQNMSSVDWKNMIMTGPGSELTLKSGFNVSSGSRFIPAHFLVRPIGNGEFRRGSFVALVNAAELGRRLSKLPDRYGGGIFVFDGRANLLASSPSSVDRGLAERASSEPGTQRLLIGSQWYRKYRLHSSYNGWTYVALMNESAITESANRIRFIAFALLGAGFLIGTALALFYASTNSKPLVRLFSLVESSNAPSPQRVSGIYERVEETLLELSHSNVRLKSEVHSAVSIAANYFFHTLLRGEYRDRAVFAQDGERYRIQLLPGFYYVIEARLPALVAALEEGERNRIVESFRDTMKQSLRPHEHCVFLATGSIALVKHADSAGNFHSDAQAFIGAALGPLQSSIGSGVLFGIGNPVADPFMLSLSFTQACAALSQAHYRPAELRGDAMSHAALFYDSLAASDLDYRYPIETESAVIKAVLSSNEVLLESLINEIRLDNFEKRTLSPAQTRLFLAAFRGTGFRLMGEFDNDTRGDAFRHRLESRDAEDISAQDTYGELALVLSDMAREKHRGKKSHNASLASSIREYVLKNFRDFNLSLTSIATHFRLSENYLSSFYKEQEGECLSEFIQRSRMNEAARLLAETRDSVDSIAGLCGYANGSSFRRAFKRIHGLSPSDWRIRRSS